MFRVPARSNEDARGLRWASDLGGAQGHQARPFAAEHLRGLAPQREPTRQERFNLPKERGSRRPALGDAHGSTQGPQLQPPGDEGLHEPRQQVEDPSRDLEHQNCIELR